MLEVQFSGWFQCRLATDPDPHDEPRGVSGYVQAYVGEPDLDRIIHWQAPGFQRPYAPAVGVTVRQVLVDGQHSAGHPLAKASVHLLDKPKFEGRNGVIADDGDEPIYPFRLQMRSDSVRFERSVEPADKEYPFKELLAAGVEGGPPVAADIMRVTGLAQGIVPLWVQRLEKLRADLVTADAAARPGMQERIRFLQQSLADPGGTHRFFGVRMQYRYALASRAEVTGDVDALGAIDTESPWLASFWLGGWDADALCGFAFGSLVIPFVSESGPVRRRGMRRP